jgi:DNA/RNA endonuclease YhcR with UshA esterase domain
MPPVRIALPMICIALLTIAAPSAAHHSFAGEYDQTKPLRVEGTVVRLDWRNPHAILTLAAVTAAGESTTWTFEMGAPRVLADRLGWPADAIKTGDRVIVEGFLARNGGRAAAATYVTTASGARLRSVLPFR